MSEDLDPTEWDAAIQPQNAVDDGPEAVKRTIRLMAGYQISEREIARALGLELRAMQIEFAEVLTTAKVDAKARVAETCYRLATDGKNPGVTMFWLKTQGGWRDKE